jgi:molybdopterin-guanine dinucleotide biosynthesis protein A
MTSSAVIVALAGGRATRMGGGDKALRRLGGRTLLDHVLARLAGQAERIVLNANGDPARFARFGLPVVADGVPDHPGPLAGVLAGMEWAATHAPDATDIVSVPVDCPFIPRDLVARLIAARDEAGAELACATSLGQAHPVVGLWPRHLAPALRTALTQQGARRIDAWTARFRLVQVPFAADPVDPFFNANRPEDLVEAEALLNQLPYCVSADPALLDFDVIHAFLRGSYWSTGIPRALVEQAASHSTPFGLYRRTAATRPEQIGYLRVLSDTVSFAYLMDVFVLEAFRGQGLARLLVQTAMADARFQEVRTWLLATRDAHGLYRKLGFNEVEPGRYMRRSFLPGWMEGTGAGD